MRKIVIILLGLALTACGNNAAASVAPIAVAQVNGADPANVSAAQASIPTETETLTSTATRTLTSSATPTQTHTSSPTLTPTATFTPTAAPTVTPTASSTPARTRLWVTPDAPTELWSAFARLIGPNRYEWVTEEKNAQVRLIPTENGAPLWGSWYYVPVAPFATVADDVSWAAIQDYWKGNTGALASLSVDGTQAPAFIVSESVLSWLTDLLGPPAPQVALQIVPPEQVPKALWDARPAAWSIVPFNRLDHTEKALTIDGANLLSPTFANPTYPLMRSFSLLTETPAQLDSINAALSDQVTFSRTNRDPSLLTVLVMTGVTALTRATAYQMEKTGINLPARDILPFLSDADFVHTSNEVSFTPDCPYPNPIGGMTFCSRDTYFDLLKTIHLKLVELTGNHVNDWGTDALSHSLDLYDANGMLTFGGGRNTEDARDAATIEHHGNHIAFIGCNPVGPAYAWAKADSPGAAPCDDAYLSVEIARLKAAGNIVIMTIQYQEYYQYYPPFDQVAFFKKYAAMGADLVMGSQAHQPQGFEFVGDTFIHYGIGNLFFDQMDYITTRRMFADKLIFYNGKHISTTLFTGLNEDYSRPRPMTPQERAVFLKTIFDASGW